DLSRADHPRKACLANGKTPSEYFGMPDHIAALSSLPRLAFCLGVWATAASAQSRIALSAYHNVGSDPFGGRLLIRQTPSLQRLLEAELARFPGRAGIWVKHLTTGDSASVRGDEAFNSASVIKLPILALAFEMADRRALSLADRVTITEADKRGGSGIFRYND